MKIQLKRSSVLDGGVAKAPEAAQMEFGELAINYNTADPALFVKDSAGNIVKSDLNFDSSAFVKTIGDNMTGNLTLGTTNIILDAITGAAAFTGLVTVGDNKVSLTNTGNGTFTGTLTATALSDGTVTKDMTDVLGGSGGGGAQVFVSENAPQAADLEEGTLWWNSSDTSAQLFILYTDPVAGAGDVGGKMWIQASPPGFIDGNVYLPLNGGNMVGNLTFNTDKITLNATTGKSYFSDNLQVSSGGPNVNVNGGEDFGVFVGAGGVLTITGSASRSVMARGFEKGSTSQKWGIYSNGDIISSGYISSKAYLYMGPNGSENPNITLNATDGSAEFASNVYSEGSVQAAVGGSTANVVGAVVEGVRISNGGTVTSTVTGASNFGYRVYAKGDTSIKAGIKGDGTVRICGW